MRFMETLEFIKKAEGGKIILDIPENLQGKELMIKVSEQDENDEIKKFKDMPLEERLRVLKQYQGTAKYPDTDVSKYDVYDQ
jgi:hypothetical protein